MQNWQRRDAETKKLLLFISMTRKLEALKRETNAMKRNMSRLKMRANGRRNLLTLDSSSNNNSWLFDNARVSHPRVSRQRSIFPHAFSNRAKLIRDWTNPPSKKNVTNAATLLRTRT